MSAPKAPNPDWRNADQSEYLSVPMPRYPNGKWPVGPNGEIVDVNKIPDPFGVKKIDDGSL